MSLTLGLTGMDPATETALRAAFAEANARLGGHWSLVPDAEAGHVIVDMDSMYGPMSWLRLHAAGRQVIGLTSAPRTQTDFRLGRPFDIGQVMDLLVAVARAEGTELRESAAGGESAGAVSPAPAPTPVQEPAPALAPAGTDAAEAAPERAAEPAAGPDPVPAPEPEPGQPPESVLAPDAAARATPAAELPAAVHAPGPATPAAPPEAASSGTTTPPAPRVPQPAPPAADTLAAWLQPGALSGRVRYRRSSGPTLLIDGPADAWYGPTPLKPIAGYFEGRVQHSDFEALDADAWARETASAGERQPLSRLRWLAGLLAGKGALVAGLEAGDRFQLSKWPQTEREYPRHFRIATQMMKGPATVAEIAEASGVPEPDVADFVNANLATGFAAPVVEAPPAPEEPVKPRGGLLGRLRSR